MTELELKEVLLAASNKQRELELLIYTVDEVAKILKTNVSFVHKLRKSGLLKFMKLGCYKVRKAELERFLVECDGLDLTDPFNVTELASG